MIINNAQEFFKKLAEFYNIPINNRWSLVLWEKIHKHVDIKSSGLLRTWISRDIIPKHAIERLLTLDIPNDLKAYCEEKKSKIHSLKQYNDIGKCIQGAYDQFNKLSVVLSNDRRNKQLKKHINKIIAELIELKSGFDSKVFEDYPDLDFETKASIFYRTGAVAEHSSEYGACEDSLDEWPDEIKNACRQVKKILDSDHPVIKPALISNLAAFQYSVEKEKSQDDQIENLKERLKHLEKYHKAKQHTGTDGAASSSTGKPET